jgi:hypothetical protein
LISKFISTPLWVLLERKDIHIADMGKYYLMLTTFLREATDNISHFMAGTLLPFGDAVDVKKDHIYTSLTTENAVLDGCTEVMLGVLLPAISKLCCKMFVDHLPGGKFAEATPALYSAAQGAPKHNKFAEQAFGYWDGLLRYRPHISTLSSESYVMFCLNKTAAWLQGQEDDVIIKAQKQGRELTRLFKIRREAIIATQLAALQAKRLQIEQQRVKRLRELEEQTDAIVSHGLWQSAESIDTESKLQSVSEKLEALKAQLRFRKNVFKQEHCDKKIYNFSCKQDNTNKRRDLTWQELATNLKQLVEHSLTVTTTQQPGAPLLVNKRVRHQFEVDGEGKQWFTGRVVSQVNISKYLYSFHYHIYLN